MSYAIDKGIEIPSAGKIRESTYPWAQMAIGDSFLVPAGDRKPSKLAATLKQAAASWVKRNELGWRFTARVVEENDGRGVRIWRTE